jgi:hypothetical protein
LSSKRNAFCSCAERPAPIGGVGGSELLGALGGIQSLGQIGKIGSSGVVWNLLPIIIRILKNGLGGTKPCSFSGEQDFPQANWGPCPITALTGNWRASW